MLLERVVTPESTMRTNMVSMVDMNVGYLPSTAHRTTLHIFSIKTLDISAPPDAIQKALILRPLNQSKYH